MKSEIADNLKTSGPLGTCQFPFKILTDKNIIFPELSCIAIGHSNSLNAKALLIPG